LFEGIDGWAFMNGEVNDSKIIKVILSIHDIVRALISKAITPAPTPMPIAIQDNRVAFDFEGNNVS
jgi:hypothetical protein